MQEIVFLPFIYSLRIHPDPFLSTTKIVPVGSTRIASPRLITPRQQLPQQHARARAAQGGGDLGSCHGYTKRGFGSCTISLNQQTARASRTYPS
jgi:hypothetical protein